MTKKHGGKITSSDFESQNTTHPPFRNDVPLPKPVAVTKITHVTPKFPFFLPLLFHPLVSKAKTSVDTAYSMSRDTKRLLAQSGY